MNVNTNELCPISRNSFVKSSSKQKPTLISNSYNNL